MLASCAPALLLPTLQARLTQPTRHFASVLDHTSSIQSLMHADALMMTTHLLALPDSASPA